MIALAPNEKTTKEIYAMCTQQSLSASNSNSKFTVGEIATGDLARLTAEIEKSTIHNTLGQYAGTKLLDNTLGQNSWAKRLNKIHGQNDWAKYLGKALGKNS